MTGRFAQIALFAAVLTFASACGAAADHASAPSGERGSGTAAKVPAKRLEHGGVSIQLPNGWQGRVLRPGLLQAANFKFAPVGVELPPGEEDPIKAMTTQHALIVILPCGLVSFEEPPRPAPERISLADLTFLPSGHPRVPRGHAFAHGSFDLSGRCLGIEADFGGAPPPPELKDTVNAILASLAVAET